MQILLCVERIKHIYQFRYQLPQNISFYNMGLRPREGRRHARSTGEQGGSSHCNRGQMPNPQIAPLRLQESKPSGEEEGGWDKEEASWGCAEGIV